MVYDKYGYNKPSLLSKEETVKERERRRKITSEFDERRQKVFESLGKEMAREIVSECRTQYPNPNEPEMDACIKGASIGLKSAGIRMPHV